MSAQTDSSISTVEIYIPLLNEGTDVLRPALGRIMPSGDVEVLSTPAFDPDSEEWQFPPGTKVHCSQETHNGRTILVARTKLG
jgi:hypothetical protein